MGRLQSQSIMSVFLPVSAIAMARYADTDDLPSCGMTLVTTIDCTGLSTDENCIFVRRRLIAS